ncbi:FliI/YscN family ATPase [Buchnera aphidicola (Kurisakia onigurumii)]|uniref:FliI/YscN family ATPase n=1 Tax=Buchnera aphidicola TaxID=9 RepID=UPI0031B6C056
MIKRMDRWLEKINNFRKKIEYFPELVKYGCLTSSIGLLLEVKNLQLPIGSQCVIEKILSNGNILYIESEVVGFKNKKIILMPFQDPEGLSPGSRVYPKNFNKNNTIEKKIPVGFNLLGRVVDCFGNALDGKKKIKFDEFVSITNKTINPLEKSPINSILDVGIRSINTFLTIGRGQRMGIFSTAGVGKSMLLTMITKFTKADIIVVGLIGERSREVTEFIKSIQNNINIKNIIVVVSTASNPALVRVQASLYSVRIAEYFREKKKNVLLIIDSLTRFAMAHREISLSLGEIPSTKGYPTSVFSKLLLFIERCGNGKNKEGSISSFYTILTEGEGESDPVSETAKSILDGHIILSKKYAESGHYPAIDMEKSISRAMPNLVEKEHYYQSCYLKKIISIYNENKDLINVGAYIHGSNPNLDEAIKIWPYLEKFLQQDMFNKCSFESSYEEFIKLLKK